MRIALIAHDNKKADMVAFVSKRLPFFNEEDVHVVATGTTGSHCKRAGIKKVERVQSGTMGGDAEIAAMVTRGQIDLVIFQQYILPTYLNLSLIKEIEGDAISSLVRRSVT